MFHTKGCCGGNPVLADWISDSEGVELFLIKFISLDPNKSREILNTFITAVYCIEQVGFSPCLPLCVVCKFYEQTEHVYSDNINIRQDIRPEACCLESIDH